MRKLVKRFMLSGVVAVCLTLMMAITVMAYEFTEADYNATAGQAELTVENVHEGDQFQVWCLVVIGYDADSNSLTYGFTPAAKDYFDSKDVTIEEFMSMSSDSSNLNNLLAGLPEAIRTNAGGKWQSPWGGNLTADASGTVSVSNCKAGGYFILPIASTSVYRPMFTAIVPEVVNGSYQYNDVTITAKHSDVSISKQVKLNTETASYADSAVASYNTVDAYTDHSEVKYQIVIDVPTYLPGSSVRTTMKVEDTLPAGITLKADSVKIYGVNSNTDSGVELTADTNYKLTCSDEKIFVDFTDYYASVCNYGKVKIEYIGIVGSDAKVGTANSNKAEYTYSCYPYVDDEVTEKTIEDVADVFTYGIKLEKYDNTDPSKKLENAVFELYRPADQKEITDSEIITEKLIVDDVEKDVVRIADTLTIKTEADGTVLISGLKDGEYYLVEKTAPSGYHLDTVPKKVAVTAALDDKENGYQFIKIGNSKANLTLPTTGSSGMVIFTVIGLMGMALAIVLLLVTGRKSSSVKSK